MIKWCVKTNKEQVRIDIKGHAEYAKYGQDIVCASVSTLVYFFINCVKNIDEDSIKHTSFKDGDVTIKLDNIKKTKPLLEVFQQMMRYLETDYPQCLKEVEFI